MPLAVLDILTLRADPIPSQPGHPALLERIPRGIDSALQRCAEPGANALGATIALGLPVEAGMRSMEAAIAAVQAMINAATAVGASDRMAFLNWVRIVFSLIDLHMSGTTYLRQWRTEARAPFLFDFRLALLPVAFARFPLHLRTPSVRAVFMAIA